MRIFYEINCTLGEDKFDNLYQRPCKHLVFLAGHEGEATVANPCDGHWCAAYNWLRSTSA